LCIHHHPQFVGSETIIQFATKGVHRGSQASD
jgi:hypothetical protein